MPIVLLVVLEIFGGLVALISLMALLTGEDAWKVFFPSLTITVALILWVCLASQPKLVTEILTPVKADNVVCVVVDNGQIYNMTSYFGKEIDISKYNIRMYRQMGGMSDGISWQSIAQPTFELVEKQKSINANEQETSRQAL